ncbi:iron-sulfur cluster-binding domain-containing protein [Ilyomonas limi]|uniref:Iron-sulfur cluster-binding domain-containing protein n=1 Tax=Ilyomonas limi TaxID=2575867 RepID=A0A4U3L187_9BACT|nr:iron-sulfur cluster-binding domain-containing protein [Ilyomonas limi]TKK68620.1 iron-sulfur cluster-binding domain-containing protein [Ilyomonas limi]
MELPINNPLLKKLTVTRITEEAPGFKTFIFEEDAANRIHYQAGQYLTFIHYFNGIETRRSYSITSSPVLNEPLAVGVKRIENGLFSRFMTDKVQPGDVLETIGAAGLFTLPENIKDYKQVFFFAAGSGITPIYSIIKTILHQHSHIHAVLIYSSHSQLSTAFLHELRQIQQQFTDRLIIEFLFSTDKNIYRAHLHRDFIFSLVNQYKKAIVQQVLAYVCGPVNYMRMCIYTLQELNIPTENIKKENFNTQKVNTVAEPPDKQPYNADIYFAGQAYRVIVNYPDTILKAAKKEGIALPYSCEAGKCGNCTMRCTKGEVWMSYNEVLTPKDIEQGLVLTCVGHPVFGDVELHA